MKTRTRILFLVLGVLFTTPSQAQWQQVTSYPFEQYMVRVYAVDSLYVWAVAWTNPGIQRSTDGGRTWDALPDPPGTSNVNFTGVFFHNRQVGFVTTTGGYSTSPGMFFKTTDGGQNWERLTNPTSDGIPQHIIFLDSLNGWACGATGQLYYYKDTSGTNSGIVWRTTNGGKTWTYQRLGKPEYGFRNMQMLPSGFGVVVGNSSELYYTYDFGSTWQSRNFRPYSTACLWKAHFWNKQSGYLLVYDSKVFGVGSAMYRTRNGGASWEMSASFPTMSTYAYVVDSLTVWVACNGIYASDYAKNYIQLTTDGGRTWSKQYETSDQTMLDIQVMGSHAWVVGSQIWRYEYAPPVNHAPIIFFSTPLKTVYTGVTYRWPYLAVDTDGDPITVTIDYSKSPSWVTVDAVRSEFVIAVPLGARDSFRFVGDAKDQKGGITPFNSDSIRIDRVTHVEGETPQEFSLSQNYPNPFNPTTTISYSLPRSANVLLTVYNALGQEVATLVNGHQSIGVHSVSFNGTSLPSGVYMYRITAGNYVAAKRMLLVK